MHKKNIRCRLGLNAKIGVYIIGHKAKSKNAKSKNAKIGVYIIRRKAKSKIAKIGVFIIPAILISF